MEGDSGHVELEDKIRRQVDQILEEIRGTVPVARRAPETLTFEDIAAATARAVVPSLLVDLPLEMERMIRRVPDGAGEAPEARVELLRLIVSRLSAEWTEMAGRLERRLAEVVDAAHDKASVNLIREDAARRFRAARPWAVLLGAPASDAAEGRRKTGPPVSVAEDLAEKIADSVARRVEVSRPPAPPDLAERVAEATADRVKSGVIGDLRRELAGIQDSAARTEVMRAVLRGELERALGSMGQTKFQPDEVRLIAAHIAHALGGTLTNWIFGAPRKEGGGKRRWPARGRGPARRTERKAGRAPRRKTAGKTRPARRRRAASSRRSAGKRARAAPVSKTKARRYPRRKVSAKPGVRGTRARKPPRPRIHRRRGKVPRRTVNVSATRKR